MYALALNWGQYLFKGGTYTIDYILKVIHESKDGDLDECYCLRGGGGGS